MTYMKKPLRFLFRDHIIGFLFVCSENNSFTLSHRPDV